MVGVVELLFTSGVLEHLSVLTNTPLSVSKRTLTELVDSLDGLALAGAESYSSGAQAVGNLSLLFALSLQLSEIVDVLVEGILKLLSKSSRTSKIARIASVTLLISLRPIIGDLIIVHEVLHASVVLTTGCRKVIVRIEVRDARSRIRCHGAVVVRRNFIASSVSDLDVELEVLELVRKSLCFSEVRVCYLHGGKNLVGDVSMSLTQLASLSHVGCRRLSACVVVLDSAHATSDLHASLIRLIVKPIRICGRDLSFLRHVALVVRETTLASTCSVRHDAVAALELSTSTLARADGASLRNLAHSTHVRHRVESILR